MDKATLILLDEMLERAAASISAGRIAKESIRLKNPTRERIQLAGETLVERAADLYPELDAYVSSSTEGTINLVLRARNRQ